MPRTNGSAKTGAKKAPTTGALVIDASELASFIKDLPPGATRGNMRAHNGIADAVSEVRVNHARYGAQLGISKSDVDELPVIEQQLVAIAKYLPAVSKLLEMLTETQSALDNRREQIVRGVADAIDGKSKQKALYAELQAAYENTLAYRSDAAKRGAKTRAAKKSATKPT